MTILETTALCKNFKLPGKEPIEVLKGVDLKVEAGERVAIIGRSGAGKSTLLHLLGGLLKPTSGKIVRPDNFGFVFQSYHLMPELTVLENVLLPCSAKRVKKHLGKSPYELERRACELLDKMGLSSRLNHLPAELSGGERQRTAIARSLITDPSLVLADEPTGNLDALTGADILKILSELSGSETSLVLVTHSPSAAAICNRVLLLEDGILKQNPQV